MNALEYADDFNQKMKEDGMPSGVDRLRERAEAAERALAERTRERDEALKCPSLKCPYEKEVDRLTRELAEARERLKEIDDAANADAADLAKMRDGTKLSRAGVVMALQYSQQDVAKLLAQDKVWQDYCVKLEGTLIEQRDSIASLRSRLSSAEEERDRLKEWISDRNEQAATRV